MILRALGLAVIGLVPASLTWAEVPDVATDIAPVHALVSRVMQGVAAPDLIVRPGASPHDYALRPSEAAALQRADLFVWMGEGLTPWLADSATTLGAKARHLSLLEDPSTALLEMREGAGHDDHDHGEHGHDPHAWLDPVNARAWLGRIAQELSEIDPENAEIYNENARSAQDEIDALIAEVSGVLAPVKGKPFLVYHEAYQYFEKRFGMHASGAMALGDATGPGPARVARMRDLAAEQGIVCVFSEPQFDTKLVRVVFGDTIKPGELDPIGNALAPGPQFYAQLIRDMANSMARCLSE